MSFGGRLPSGQSPYPGQQQHQQYATQPHFYQQAPVPHQMQQPAYAQHQGMPSHAQPQQQQQHIAFNYDGFGQQHAPAQPIHQAHVQQAQQQQWGGFFDANSYGNGVGGMGVHGMGNNSGRSGSLGDVGGGGMHLPAANEHYLQSPTMWQQQQQQQMPIQPTVQQLAPSQMQRHHHQQPSFHAVQSPQQAQQSIPSPHQFPAQVQIQQQPPRPRPQINNQRRPSQPPLPPQAQPQLQQRQHAHVQSPIQNTAQQRASPQLQQQQQQYYQQSQPSPGLQQARPHLSTPRGPSPSQQSPSIYEDSQHTFQPQQVRHQPKPSPQLQAVSQRRPSHTPPQPRQQLRQTPPEPPQAPPEPEVQVQLQPQPQPQPPTQVSVQTPAPPEPQPPEQQYQTPAEPQFQFVNLQDIQQIPFAASSTFPTPQSLASPLTLPSATNVTSATKKHGADSPITTPVMQPKSHPTKSHQQSPRTSASQSPAMSARKVSKSPAISSKPSPYHTPSLMVNLAEEFIGKARSSAISVASTLHEDQVEDYQKLIGTGLACLDSALQSGKLSSRQEAQVRIRYATILQEETENVTEAETTLTKGITLCDKYRMFDLKYYMQYLMMKALFLRNRKAALKALDQHINDCLPYEHYSWFYAFRLLKASFYVEAGNSADPLALDNLRQMQQVASSRGDAAICVYASLAEALILLKSAKSTPEMIQERIAQAAKYQCDPSVNIHQLELMSLLIGLLMSLHRERHEETAERLRALQKKIDSWRGQNPDAEFLLPIRKDASSSQIISGDTSSIIRSGEDGSNSDFLVMSFMTEMEFTGLVFAMGGLVRLHKPSSWGKNQSLELWHEGLKLLTHWDLPKSVTVKGTPIPLSQALKQKNWRIDSRCFLHILLGLLAAGQCSWDTVKQHKLGAESLLASASQIDNIKPYLVYLSGVYCQGTGDFGTALLHYRDDALSLDSNNPTPVLFQRHLALLAGMNQLWLMQHPSYENHRATTELLNEMEPLCRDHPNVEIQGAWSCVLASVVTHPPRQRNQRKEDAGKALKNIKGNALATAMGLVIARDLLYNNVLGDQALSCMQAANVWASRSGNPLWQSVVGGIMAETAEAKNEREQAGKHWDQAVQSAQLAFSRSS